MNQRILRRCAIFIVPALSFALAPACSADFTDDADAGDAAGQDDAPHVGTHMGDASEEGSESSDGTAPDGDARSEDAASDGAVGEAGDAGDGGATGDGGAPHDGGRPGDGGKPGDSGAPGDGGSPGDGGMAGDGGSTEPNCPSSPASGTCSMPNLRCHYADVTCDCKPYCGGAVPPVLPPPTWSCAPRRTDGCPEDMPNSGSPCSEEGKMCTYSPCCFYSLACQNGMWIVNGGGCPG
jgi:hypothetical protein